MIIEVDKTKSWPDGRKYQGSFSHGKKHGHGVLTWPNGTIYDGHWSNNKRHGRGTLTWPNGAKYVGEWKGDIKKGNGVYTWQKSTQLFFEGRSWDRSKEGEMNLQAVGSDPNLDET